LAADRSEMEVVVTEVEKHQEVSSERLALAAAALDGSGAPNRVLVAPWGEVKSSSGTFIVDDEAGRAVLEAFEHHGTDLPVDYEHQSLGGTYASPNGQAPAAGWIRSLEIVPSDEYEAGLYANVEWTDAAKEKLIAREYRYLSPVVLVRKSDRRVVALHSVALTNKPAIAGMKPIVNRDQADADLDRTPIDEAVEVLRLRLGLDQQAEMYVVLAAANERLRELDEQAANRAAREKVAEAMRAGKLTSAQRGWAMSVALKDPAGFDEWLATAPQLVVLGRTEAPPNGSADPSRDRASVIASARRAFQDEPALQLLTTEEAWIRQALTEAGLAADTDISVDLRK
jgi:phage I-like protein